MPLGIKPVCISCRVTTSTLWRKGPQGEILCNSCGLKQGTGGGKDSGSNLNTGAASKNGNGNGNGNNASSSQSGGPVLRKSSRIKPAKSKIHQAATKALATKGKSRRIIFKKSQPVKAPKAVATVVTGSSVFHEGQYWQEGDIVSLADHDGGVYYAQLRGFLCDQYNQKSAVLTWLLPTQASPPDHFDPSTFILGPEEDIPRRMEFMEFVCHAPSDYFHASNTPYPLPARDRDLCFVWTSLGPEIRMTPSVDEIFGVKDEDDDSSVTSDVAVILKAGKEREGFGKDKDRGREKDGGKVVKMEVD